MNFSYEDLSRINYDPPCPLIEGYQGAAIVSWYGQIERQLQAALKDAEGASNFQYADKLRQYLQTWRSNPISGSLNVETLEVLKAPTEVMAVDAWNLGNYFSNLRDRLRQLIASEEELPRGMEMGNEPPMMGGPGRGGPPMAPTFGPEATPGGPKPPGAPEEEEEKPPGAAPGGPVKPAPVAGKGAPSAF